MTDVHLLCDVWRGEVDDYLKKKKKRNVYKRIKPWRNSASHKYSLPFELPNIVYWIEMDFIWDYYHFIYFPFCVPSDWMRNIVDKQQLFRFNVVSIVIPSEAKPPTQSRTGFLLGSPCI